MKLRSIYIAISALSVLGIAGCADRGQPPSIADISRQAAIAQANTQKEVDSIKNDPGLSDAEKQARIEKVLHHGNGQAAAQRPSPVNTSSH